MAGKRRKKRERDSKWAIVQERNTAHLRALPNVHAGIVSLSFVERSRYTPHVKAMQIGYPESWTVLPGTSPERFESDARMALSMKLFEMGRLTSGHAAQLAGVSRIAFLFDCPQWNVPAVSWDADELDAEFKSIHS